MTAVLARLKDAFGVGVLRDTDGDYVLASDVELPWASTCMEHQVKYQFSVHCEEQALKGRFSRVCFLSVSSP